jgi:DNA polymerase-3 subunit gamma/tau
MAYQVTARKWRPMVFEDVVGQSHITSTLRNAITSNRLAHAYIFSGVRGTGKTTTARILAKAINCRSPKDSNPDNTCDICQEITGGKSLDVVEIDGASNRGVEEIRSLRDSVRYPPTHGQYKVYIIDEVHMLTKEAFNALLKTLEEPPAHVIFVFATTEVHKVPPTILSRCQRFDFRRISIDEIITNLRFISREEQVAIDDEALVIVAKKADGSLRDAQSIFDQIRSFCGNEITSADVLKVLNVVDQELYFRLTDLVKTQDVRGGIELVDEIVRDGYDLREFVGGLAEHLRNLLVVLTTESTELVETSEVYRKRYQEEAKNFNQNDTLRLIKLTNDLEQSIRWAPQPRFKLEAGLLQMIKMERSVQIDGLLRQIDELKKKLDSQGGDENGRTPSTQLGHVQPATTPRVDGPAPLEVRVVGQVHAGRLKSVAAYASLSQTERQVPAITESFADSAVSTSRAREVPQAYRTDVSSLAHVAASFEPLRKITLEEAYAQWQQWVGEVRRVKIGVGTILGESQILDVLDDALRIGCPDDYHLSSLKRHKEFLVDSFQKVTGLKLRIEPVLHDGPSSTQPVSMALTATQPTNDSRIHQGPRPNNSSRHDHPVIQALKRELGAEPVE